MQSPGLSSSFILSLLISLLLFYPWSATVYFSLPVLQPKPQPPFQEHVFILSPVSPPSG